MTANRPKSVTSSSSASGRSENSAKRGSITPPSGLSRTAAKRHSGYPAARRCPVHDLALSSEGRCLRCGLDHRRTAAALEPLVEPTSRLTKLLAALVLTCLAGAAMVLANNNDDTAPTPRGLAEERVAEPPAPPAVTPDPAIAAAQQAREQQAREAAERAAASAADAARRLHEQVAQARPQVPITLYGTSWCGACRQARNYLLGQGIPFRDLDVESDPVAHAAYLRLNPSRTVPTLDIGGRVLTGFNPGELEHALQQAAASPR